MILQELCFFFYTVPVFPVTADDIETASMKTCNEGDERGRRGPSLPKEVSCAFFNFRKPCGSVVHVKSIGTEVKFEDAVFLPWLRFNSACDLAIISALSPCWEGTLDAGGPCEDLRRGPAFLKEACNLCNTGPVPGQSCGCERDFVRPLVGDIISGATSCRVSRLCTCSHSESVEPAAGASTQPISQLAGQLWRDGIVCDVLLPLFRKILTWQLCCGSCCFGTGRSWLIDVQAFNCGVLCFDLLYNSAPTRPWMLLWSSFRLFQFLWIFVNADRTFVWTNETLLARNCTNADELGGIWATFLNSGG